MCLLIAKPRKEIIPFSHLREGFESNPHGAGFAFMSRAGRLVIRKGFFTFDAFMDAWIRVPVCYQAIVHFRFATHGSVREANCHPFALPRELAMAHNGIIPGMGNRDDMSDTAIFASDCLAPSLEKHGANVLSDRAFRDEVQCAIGASKLAFIGAGDSPIIYNEDAGHWHNGVWYSNHSYVCPPRGWRFASMFDESEDDTKYFEGIPDDIDAIDDARWQDAVEDARDELDNAIGMDTW